MNRFCLIVFLLCATAASAGAQTFQVGMAPFVNFQSTPIDSINLSNGNLVLHIPVISYPEAGTLPQFGYTLYYNNLVWAESCSYDDYGIVTSCDFYPLPSAYAGYCSLQIVAGICAFGAFPAPTYGYVGFNDSIVDATGADHALSDPTYDSGETPDGLMQSTGVIDRNGIQSFSGSCGSGAGGGCLSEIKDPSGHSINFSYTSVWDSDYGVDNYVGQLSGVTDSISSRGTIPPLPVLLSPGCVTEYFPGPPGNTSVPIEECYASVSVNSNISSECSVCTDYSGSLVMLSSVTLPNGTYTLSYSSTGDLSSITLPTGGTISYTWSIDSDQLQDAEEDWGFARSISTRTLNAGDSSPKEWQYNLVFYYDPSYMTDTVTDPDSNYVVHTVASGPYAGNPQLETEAQYYDSGSHLLKTVNTTYFNEVCVYGGCGSTGLPEKITTTWPNNQVNAKCYIYDNNSNTSCTGTDSLISSSVPNSSYGSLLYKYEWDYGSGSPGSLLRETDYSYQWQGSSSYLSANFLNVPSSVTIYDGSHTLFEKSTYAYDESSYSPCSSPCGETTTAYRYTNGSSYLTSHTYYDSNGMPTSSVDPLGNSTSISYDSTGAFVSEIDYPNTGSTSHADKFSYDANTGMLTWHKDQNNQETDYSYDAARRVTGITYPDGGSDGYSYADSLSYGSTPSVIYTKKITSGSNFVTKGIVDGLGRTLQTVTTVPSSTCSGGYIYVNTGYDDLGRTAKVTNPDCSSSASTGTTTLYDPLGRSCVVIPPDGTSESSCPGSAPSGDMFMSYFDSSSLHKYCSTVTDPAGKSRESCANGLGQMSNVFEDPSSANYETDYTYNPIGNLTQVQQKGGDSNSSHWRTRTFNYDFLSRPTQAVNPESGTINYTYDGNGNVATKVAPQPNQTGSSTTTTTYCYDALNRLVKKGYTTSSCSSMTPDVTYVYDGNSVPSGCSIGSFAYGSYVKPLRTAMCDIAGSEAWDYDKSNRTITDQRTTNSVTKDVTYSYNYDGTIATIGYPSGRTLTYGVNAAEQYISAEDSANSINYVTSAYYTPFGALSSVQNGAYLISSFYYNSRMQPCRIAVNSSGTAPNSCTDSASGHGGNLMDFTYAFNSGASNNGNVVGITNNKDTTRSQTFSYDALNRISTAAASNDSTSPSHCWGESFVYDQAGGPSAWGNLIQINSIGSAYSGCSQENLSISIDPTTNRVNTSGFSYDSAGNLLGNGVLSLLYDSENRLCSAGGSSCTTGFTYTYDGDGKRVQKATGTLYWYGISSNPLAESDSSGNLTDEYVFFNGIRVARREVH